MIYSIISTEITGTIYPESSSWLLLVDIANMSYLMVTMVRNTYDGKDRSPLKDFLGLLYCRFQFIDVFLFASGHI